MQANYGPSLARIKVYEGGLANLPGDPGGLTNEGITQATYNSWRARQGQPQASVSGISEADVSAIYKKDYWDRMACDEMPAGVDFCLFDAAVNSGVGGATSWAQACLKLDADGDFGPKTKDAILGADPEAFIRDFNSRRLGTLKRLPGWSRFGKGWAARISNGQKIEIAWVEGGPAPDPVSVHTVGGNTKGRPSDVPTSRTGQIITHATTAGGTIGAAAAQAGQGMTSYADTFVWMKYIMFAIAALGVICGIIVMFGKQANDAASAATATAKVNPDADADIPTVSVAPNAGVTHG